MAVAEHGGEDLVASRAGTVGVVDRVSAARLLDETGQSGGLREGEFGGGGVEVVARRGFDTVGLVSEVDEVEVERQRLLA